MRLAPGLPSLRRSRTLALLQRVFLAGRARAGFRLVHFSIQTNHVHLLVEAADATRLSRGLQGLSIRIARRLNARWHRRGSVFADRYHARALRTPREVRHALVYVLANARKHGIGYGAHDPFSSRAWFDGWRDRFSSQPVHVRRPVTQARTWLLAIGWRRYGLIRTREAPRGAHR
jgi:REP element-mobilizing transposase RayT